MKHSSNPDPPQPKQSHVIEWEKTVQYAADHGYHAMHTALVEDGPDPEINYSALREDPALQPQAGQQPKAILIACQCGFHGLCPVAGCHCECHDLAIQHVEAAQPQPEPARTKARFVGGAISVGGSVPPAGDATYTPLNHFKPSGERVEGEMTRQVVFRIAGLIDEHKVAQAERELEAYAAHQLAERDAEIANLKRKLYEFTPEDIRGMAYDANALLKHELELSESREQRLREALQKTLAEHRLAVGRDCKCWLCEGFREALNG